MPPRHSILDLFDPLASSDYTRDAPSPDSDKENCIVSDFSFFGRPPKAPSPVRLKRRLVDVGDITVDDLTMHPMLTDEDELDDSMCDDDNDTLTFLLPNATPARDITVQQRAPSSVSLRTPLAELSLDNDITPMPLTKMYRRQPPLVLSTPDVVTPASSESSTFASVIDAVTTSGVSFAGLAGPSSDYEPGTERQPEIVISCDDKTPQITITSIGEPFNSPSALSPDTLPSILLEDVSQSLASLSLSESSEASVEHPRTTLRPISPRTSPQDIKRHSIDLYSTFQLQLQSEEASFDLLNDKISLFASSSMDSFLNGLDDDDSFDVVVEETKLQATIDIIKSEEGQTKVGEVHDTQVLEQDYIPDAAIDSRSASPQMLSTEHSKQQALGSPSLCSTSSSPVSSESTDEQNNESPEIPKQIVDAASPSSPPRHDKNSTVLCTPAPNVREQISLPPPVPALRIVKRSARPVHEKSASTNSAASSEGPTLPMTNAPVPAFAAPVSPIMRHGSFPDTNRAAHVRSATLSSSTALSHSRTGDGTGNGPRRVPIADNQSLPINKRRGFVEQKPMPQGNTTGPRRIIVGPSVPVQPTTSVPAPAPRKASAVSGLKAPAKYGIGTSAAMSALPRPVSRLPISAASGIARPPRAGAGANAAGTSIVHAKNTAYARRVV